MSSENMVHFFRIKIVVFNLEKMKTFNTKVVFLEYTFKVIRNAFIIKA